MTSTTPTPGRADGRAVAGTGVRAPRRRRALVLLAAPLAGAVTWAALVPLGGVELAARQGDAVAPVGLPAVVVTGLLVALAGWGLLAALERWTSRARLWTPVAVTVLVLSFGGALGGATAAARLGLALLHLTVGLAVVAVLAPRRSADRP